MRRFLISYSRECLMIRDRKTNEIKKWNHINRQTAELILAIHYPKNPSLKQNNNTLTIIKEN